MSTSLGINNEGMGGGPFLTMTQDDTPDRWFTRSDLDDNLSACALSGDNEIGKGAAGDKLFGKVIWVSDDMVAGTTRPVTVATQARGVARFRFVGDAPVYGDGVVLAGGGKVQRPSVADEALGSHARGQVLAVDKVNATCDVWLG